MREHAIYKDYIRYIGDGFSFSELYSYEDGKELHFNKFMDYWEDSETGRFYRWKNSKDDKIIKECHEETLDYFGYNIKKSNCSKNDKWWLRDDEESLKDEEYLPF